MTNETAGNWVECVADNDYEIYDQYPYPIRRKGKDKVIGEAFDKANGYITCKLNRKAYKKHRIIAQQFIDNPNNLPCVDHINRVRTDNRLENLRFVSYAENAKNKSSHHGIDYEYFDDIPCESPDDIIEVRDYNGNEFEDLYYCDDYFYQWNGIQYRRLHINYTKSGLARVCSHTIEGMKCDIYYSAFKRLYGID